MLTQRLGSNTQKDSCYIDEFIKAVSAHPGCCDEVWLATDYGFPTLEAHRQSAELLAEQAEKLRKAGLRVSLQLSNSIGHGEYMSSRDCSGLVYDGSPIEKMVGHDGQVADYAFCWNGKHFREYTISALHAYAEKIRPYAVWLDDDLRPTNHAPVEYGCFCDECIAKFNSLYNADFTREALVDALSDKKWQERHIKFLRDGIASFVREIGEMLHRVSPDIRLSYQHGEPKGYIGGNTRYVMDAMLESTGHAPGSRPGGSSYDDHSVSTFVGKLEKIDVQNRTEPDYVTEFRPEIESLPDVAFGKSIGGTCFETSYYLAGGNNAMSYAMLMNDYEPMAWHEEMFAAFQAHRPYWERLREGTYGTKPDGLMLALAEDGISASDAVFPNVYPVRNYRAAQKLRYDGFSIHMQLKAPSDTVRLLHADNAAQLSDKEITELLKFPVITDGYSMRILTQRGIALPIHVDEIAVIRYLERFTDHSVNRAIIPNQAWHLWGGQFGKSLDCAILPTDNNCFEPLSEYIRVATSDTPDEQCVSVANAGTQRYVATGQYASGIVTMPSGVKWAVFGFDLWERTKSLAKRDQLLEAAAYISGHRQPAEVVTPIKTLVQARTNTQGRLTQVSITNATVGDCNNVVVRIFRPAGQTAFYQSQYSEPVSLPLMPTEVPDIYTVMIPACRAWTVGTVFIK